MRASIKLFTWFGIPVHLHVSFLLIFFLALYMGMSVGGGMWGVFWYSGLFLALSTCILLHEYGHALTAKYYGIKTQDILLTPIGGLARFEKMTEKPVQEFFVTLAGPMVNVLIAGLLLLLGKLFLPDALWQLTTLNVEQYFAPLFDFFTYLFSGDWAAVQRLLTYGSPDESYSTVEMQEALGNLGRYWGGLMFYLPNLIIINIVLVLFNLIPAFPMDGGRIFRSLLALRIGRARATQIATYLGQFIAFVFIGIGMYWWESHVMLIFVGYFVFSMARAENDYLRFETLLRRFSVRDVLRPQFTRLSMNDWMQTPVALLQQGLERHFLVFNLQDELSGVLEESDIVAALKKRDLSSEIAQYAHPAPAALDADAPLNEVYQTLQQSGTAIVPVAKDGEIVGVVDRVGLQNFLRVHF